MTNKELIYDLNEIAKILKSENSKYADVLQYLIFIAEERLDPK